MLHMMPSKFPVIDTLNPSRKYQPFWSVMIPTYNSSLHLEKTLDSVLIQDMGKDLMQIEVVDDCSTDSMSQEITQQVGNGRISFSRNSSNLGFVNNWNECIKRSKGYWVHILHQDDLVLPNFYKELQILANQHKEVGSAIVRYAFINKTGHWLGLSDIEMDQPGILDNWLEKIARVQTIRCPAIVVKRKVYESIGGYCHDAGFAADWEMWKRIAVNYPVAYQPQILACYRVHSESETFRLQKSSSDIQDIQKSIAISQAYLPPEKSKRLSKDAAHFCAIDTLKQAQYLLRTDHFKAALVRLFSSYSLYVSRQVIFETLVFLGILACKTFSCTYIKTFIKQKWQPIKNKLKMTL